MNPQILAELQNVANNRWVDLWAMGIDASAIAPVDAISELWLPPLDSLANLPQDGTPMVSVDNIYSTIESEVSALSPLEVIALVSRIIQSQLWDSTVAIWVETDSIL